MTLPEIPNEAIDALLRAFAGDVDPEPFREEYKQALLPAWPHLYATAIQDVTDAAARHPLRRHRWSQAGPAVCTRRSCRGVTSRDARGRYVLWRSNVPIPFSRTGVAWLFAWSRSVGLIELRPWGAPPRLWTMRRGHHPWATLTTIEGRRRAPAGWRLVDAHECTRCGHLDRDGYRMAEHLRTHGGEAS